MQPAFDPTRFKLRKRTGYNLIAARYKTAGGARAPVKNRMRSKMRAEMRPT